ncbi:hypothetical protein ACVPOY_03785 [Staphylococcus aureus]
MISIAQLNPDVINDAYQNLKPEQEEEYNELETQNGKIAFIGDLPKRI